MDPHFDGVIFHTHAAELHRRLAHAHPPHRVLDVRPRGEYEAGHIPGAVSVPAGDAAGLGTALPAGTEAYVVAADPWDPAAETASRTLLAAGARRVVVLTGGMEEWRARGLPVESRPGQAAA